MKKFLIVFIALLLLSSCSVQEKVSPGIFVERLCAADENAELDNDLSFGSGEVYTYYITYAQSLRLVAEMRSDGQGNVKKINLACNKTDKADLFMQCVKSVICVYSPEENPDEILKAVFPGKESDGTFFYHETQWYKYSAVLSENGLFFSTENKKVSPQSEVEFSLKPNDIVEY